MHPTEEIQFSMVDEPSLCSNQIPLFQNVKLYWLGYQKFVTNRVVPVVCLLVHPVCNRDYPDNQTMNEFHGLVSLPLVDILQIRRWTLASCDSAMLQLDVDVSWKSNNY